MPAYGLGLGVPFVAGRGLASPVALSEALQDLQRGVQTDGITLLDNKDLITEPELQNINCLVATELTSQRFEMPTEALTAFGATETGTISFWAEVSDVDGGDKLIFSLRGDGADQRFDVMRFVYRLQVVVRVNTVDVLKYQFNNPAGAGDPFFEVGVPCFVELIQSGDGTGIVCKKNGVVIPNFISFTPILTDKDAWTHSLPTIDGGALCQNIEAKLGRFFLSGVAEYPCNEGGGELFDVSGNDFHAFVSTVGTRVDWGVADFPSNNHEAGFTDAGAYTGLDLILISEALGGAANPRVIQADGDDWHGDSSIEPQVNPISPNAYYTGVLAAAGYSLNGEGVLIP